MGELPSQQTVQGASVSDGAYVLPSALTIESIESLAAEFKQWPFQEKSHLTLDASQVDQVTTPGLQLIVSIEKTLAAQGGSLIIHAPKEPFVRAFNDAGLQSILN